VYEKSLEIRRFWVFHFPEELELAVPGPLESLGMDEIKETAPTEAVWFTIEGCQEAKLMEMVVQRLQTTVWLYNRA
jgi:hypothetical protein